MRLVLCTLALNEEDIISRCIAQHRNWPGRLAHIVVEGSDPIYPRKHPYTSLSVDSTGEILQRHYDAGDIHYVAQLGGGEDVPQDQFKCVLREAYLKTIKLEGFEPDWIAVIDADEFYTVEDQQDINDQLQHLPERITAAIVPQIHHWRPPKIIDSKNHSSRLHATGGYWSVPHVRFFRWRPGMTYLPKTVPLNHNWPVYPDGTYANSQHTVLTDVLCHHYGFAPRNPEGTLADIQYYEARGEKQTRKPTWRCRTAWRSWSYDDLIMPNTWKGLHQLPKNVQIIPWTDSVPEEMEDW